MDHDEVLVKVIQFIRPNGRKEIATTWLPSKCADAYRRMEESGCRFEAEVLTTGEVSLAISDDDSDRTMRVVENGPVVQQAMCEMLLELFSEPLTS